jgi:hypothetical protein
VWNKKDMGEPPMPRQNSLASKLNEPPSISYASRMPVDGDDEGHLKAIVICHYVWGGLALLFSCIFIVHIVMGVLMVNGKFGPNTGPNGPPPQFGYLFICMGSGFMFLGWALGILTLMSGRAIAKRKWRMFSLVIAGVNCASFPLGTLLGVFTFIVLLRASVRSLYPA